MFSVVLASERLFRKVAVRTAEFGPTVTVEVFASRILLFTVEA